MSQVVIAPLVNCTHAELASIVANASFLWERLDPERFIMDDEQINEPEIARRCDRWCQIVAKGNWDTLQKRLQWEGLRLDTVRPRLGTVRTGTQPLPEWAETLRKIMQTATEFTSVSESFLPTDPDHPIPFQDILLPAIIVARQQLLTRLGSLATHGKIPSPIDSHTSCLSSIRTQLAATTGRTLQQDAKL